MEFKPSKSLALLAKSSTNLTEQGKSSYNFKLKGFNFSDTLT